MKPQDDMERFAREARIDTNEAVDRQVLEKIHAAYEGSAVLAQPAHRGPIFRSHVARLAAAAVVLVTLGALVGQLGVMLTGGSVAWADVAQRFQSVPFFYASIYMKDNALAQPQQFELWMGKGGFARIRAGSQVIFGRDGQVVKAFDIHERHEVQADETAANIIELLATTDEFSLDTVIRSISGGKLVDVTPSMNNNVALGEDLAVFDAQSMISPGWVRIYALRESRLPVGLRIWDPAEGFSVDALIAYAKEQPQVFFDPEAFAQVMEHTQDNETDLAYLFLNDPGGQALTPKDLWSRSRQGADGAGENL